MIVNPVVSGGGGTETVEGILNEAMFGAFWEIVAYTGESLTASSGLISGSFTVQKNSVIYLSKDSGPISVSGGIEQVQTIGEGSTIPNIYFVTGDFTAN